MFNKATVRIGMSLVVSTLMGACSDIVQPDPPTRIRVENNSSVAVVAVKYSSCSDTGWGPNRLTTTLSPGQRREFDVAPPGCWDVLVAGSLYALEWDGIQIERGITKTFSFTN